MKSFKNFVKEENITEEKDKGMTKKQHSEITRTLKQKVSELHKKRIEATEAHGAAERELENHRMKSKEYVEKKMKKQEKGYADYHETGRSVQRGHSGWTGHEN
jgi:hypothetical protein